MSDFNYQKEYYELIKGRLDNFEKSIDSFRKTLSDLEDKMDRRFRENESELAKVKSKLSGMLGWSAGAGAVASVVLTLILFIVGKYL